AGGARGRLPPSPGRDAPPGRPACSPRVSRLRRAVAAAGAAPARHSPLLAPRVPGIPVAATAPDAHLLGFRRPGAHGPARREPGLGYAALARVPAPLPTPFPDSPHAARRRVRPGPAPGRHDLGVRLPIRLAVALSPYPRHRAPL